MVGSIAVGCRPAGEHAFTSSIVFTRFRCESIGSGPVGYGGGGKVINNSLTTGAINAQKTAATRDSTRR